MQHPAIDAPQQSYLSMRSVAPAIALGNTVVLKPATDTAVTGESGSYLHQGQICIRINRILVSPIIRFSGDEDGVRIPNDTAYGPSSAVFTRDLERGMAFAKRIDAGMTHINDWTVNVDANTAIGGAWAVDAFTTAHWISTQDIPRAYPL